MNAMRASFKLPIWLLFIASSAAMLMAETSTARAAVLQHPSWWREAPDGARKSVYVSQADGAGAGMVFGYRASNRRNAPPLCSIGNLSPSDSDLGTDAAGNLYVPDVTTSAVTVYAPGCGAVLGSFTDPYGTPQGAVISGSTIYVADAGGVAICTTSGCPSRLTDPSILQITGSAVDSHGNVWAAYYASNIAISLIVWPKGKMPGKVVNGFVNSTTPGALLFDKQDRLVSIVSHFSFLFTYACDANSASCSNTGEIILQGASDFGALNRRNDEIQVTDEGNHCVDVYAYPSFQYEYSYNRGLVPGYAVVGIVQTR
jgi:hypothetical protein